MKVSLATFQKEKNQPMYSPLIEEPIPDQEAFPPSTFCNPYFGNEISIINSILLLEDALDYGRQRQKIME